MNKTKNLDSKTIEVNINDMATTYFPGFYPSIISAGKLNFSVRNGKRWTLPL